MPVTFAFPLSFFLCLTVEGRWEKGGPTYPLFFGVRHRMRRGGGRVRQREINEVTMVLLLLQGLVLVCVKKEREMKYTLVSACLCSLPSSALPDFSPIQNAPPSNLLHKDCFQKKAVLPTLYPNFDHA